MAKWIGTWMRDIDQTIATQSKLAGRARMQRLGTGTRAVFQTL